MGIPDIAFAYRPFDGPMRRSLSPVKWKLNSSPPDIEQQWPKSSGAAPATVLNFGLVKNWRRCSKGRVKRP
jgi:hypothetical protein